MRGFDTAAAAQRRRSFRGNIVPAIRRIYRPAHSMEEVTQRLQIGLVPGGSKLEVKRDPREVADAQVVGVATAPTPRARPRFDGRAIIPGHGAHCQTLL